MTQDEIIEMAEKTGVAFASEEYPDIWQTYMHVGKKELEAFAKLVAEKEHEAMQALAQPEQEPVAWRGYNWGHSPDDWVYRDFDDPILDGNGNNVGQPLYTTPPQRKPLTDEQILHFVDIHVGAPSMAYPLDNSDWITFARAIEAAHGIKE